MRNALIKSSAFILPAIGLAALGWFGTDSDVRIPVHWGLDGEADRYGGRVEAFLLLPVIMIGLSAVFAILPAIDPRGSNLKRSSVVLGTAWMGLLAFLLALQAGMVALGLGWLSGDGVGLVPTLTLAAVGGLQILLGNVLGKARPNWFVGIRTPWTLSSDLAWDKTHRLTGRLMVLSGSVILVSSWFLPSERLTVLVLIVALAPMVVGLVYSYLVWRSDPDRDTATPDDVD